MSDEKEADWDRPVTVRDLMAMAEQHHLTMAHITSCLIKVSTALRSSDESLRREEGQAIYDEIDSVIARLEDAGKIADRICSGPIGKDHV